MLVFNDDYHTPANLIGGEEYERVQADHHILLTRRQQLGMTQQQVADAAGIQLRQYQRLESGERSMSGASMRIGLSICTVLKLDPYRFEPLILPRSGQT